MLVDDSGRLVGLFTDSDLAKILEQRRDLALDEPIAEAMTRRFSAIRTQARLTDALSILAHRKISELPVISPDDRPMGLIDITDVIALMDPHEHFRTATSEADQANGINDASTYPVSIRLFP